MDFISFPDLPDVSWAAPTMFTGFIFLVLVYIVGTIVTADSRNPDRWAAVFYTCLGAGALAFIIGMATFIFSMVGMTNAASDWKKAAIAEVEEAYGIELTASEFAALGFPKHEPEDDFVAYGSIDRTEKSGDTFEKRELTLIWSDGELFLAQSVDGEEFVPLEAR